MDDSTPQPTPARRAVALPAAAAVFVCALAARLWVLTQAAGTPHFLPQQTDMKFYSDWALRIAAGHWTDHHAFYGLPLYAYLLGGIYRLVGFQPYVAILLQTVAEAGTSLLLYKLALLVWNSDGGAESKMASVAARTVGWLAALGWALYVPAQAYAVVLMPAAYLVLAFWAVVWWVLRRRPARPGLGAFALVGAGMGFTAMMAANILFLVPLVVAAVFLRRAWTGWGPRPGALRAAASALLLGGIVAGASPCWLHNWLAAGDPVFLSAHGGINFYLGNNAQSNGYPSIPPGLRTDQEGLMADSILVAERAAGQPLPRSEVSRYWSAQAKDYIREHPGASLRLLATKLGCFWNGFQYDDVGIIGALRADGVLLPGLTFGLVAALALPGAALAAARRPAARWVVAAVALHMISLLPVFVTERYRLASVPGLLVLAAVGGGELWRALASRRWPAGAVYAGVLLGAVLLTTWPVDPALRNVEDYNTALADLEEGRLDDAQTRLERVYQTRPDNAAVCLGLGNLWLAKGDHGRAKWFYLRAVQLDPRQERALNNLAVLAMQEKRWPLAERFLLGALRIKPDDAKVSYLLAQARYEQADLPGARTALDAALRLEPARAEFRQLDDTLKTAAVAPPP